jgi:ABC-2 type transport system permease protein
MSNSSQSSSSMLSTFVWARAIAIAKKEVFHIMRDPFTLALALVMPIFMVVIYGIAIDFNVRNIRLAVSDSDQTQTSRRLIETFGSSQYFQPFSAGSPVDTLADLEDESARASLIIPPRFEKDLLAGRDAQAQILVDGADNSTVASVTGYVGAIQTLSAKNIANFDPPQPYELRTRYLFNPELNSRWFVIPGLTVVVMAILSILLTALTVAREWENGSMELLLSTPVQPLEIIIGKLTPYGVLGIIAVTFVYVIARVGFGVPFVGNIFVFGAGCLLFLVTYLAQGLLISVITRKQMVAMQFAMLTGFLPSQLLSGFVFPVQAMPPFFRYFTMIFPARWFMEISRDTFLKGSSIFDLWLPFSSLTFLCAFMIRRATQKFKRDLEP